GEDIELDRREQNLGRPEAHADVEDALRCENHETSDTRASRPTTPATLRKTILARGDGESVDWSKSAPYCVSPFLLPSPKNPCSTRAKKASQAGRRRFDPGRPLSSEAPVRSGASGGEHLRLASGENGSRGAREGRAAATWSARTRRAASSTSRPPVPPRCPRRLGRAK